MTSEDLKNLNFVKLNSFNNTLNNNYGNFNNTLSNHTLTNTHSNPSMSSYEKESTAQIHEVLSLSNAITTLDLDEIKTIVNTKKIIPSTLNKMISKAFQVYSSFTNNLNNSSELIKIKDIIFFLLSQPNSEVDVYLNSEKTDKKNKREKEKWTGLLFASQKGDYDMVKRLLELKLPINTNITDSYSKNPLMHLISSSNSEEPILECVNLLLKNNILVNAEDYQGNTALTLAVSKKFYETVQILLKAGANVDQQVKSSQNNTPLHIAVNLGCISLTRLLLLYKPNFLIKNDLGSNALDAALSGPSSDIYSLLAEENKKRHELIALEEGKNRKEIGKFVNSNRQTPTVNKLLTTSDIQPKNLNNLNSFMFNDIKDYKDVNAKDILGSSSCKEFLYGKLNVFLNSELKHSKIKSIIENSKIDLPKANVRMERCEKAQYKIYEQELLKLKKENALLKVENQYLKNEINLKDNYINETSKEKDLNSITVNLNNCTNKNKDNLIKILQNPSSLNILTSHINCNFLENLMNNSQNSKKDILEKKFNTAMYNNEYVLRSLHKDLLDFQEYNRELIKNIKPIQEELLDFIRQAVNETMPDFEVKLYGSHATGLCLSWSDLDTVLVFKKGHEFGTFNGLQNLYLNLKEKTWLKSIKFIDTAVIPLIKITASDKYNNMQIDISVQDSKHYGLKCVELVKGYIAEFEALEPLLYSLKNLLKNANLNDPYTGGLSSYGLILMLVSFLHNQQMHGKNISISREKDSETIGRLFLEFCYYYGAVFDHTKFVINAYPLNGNENYQERETFNYYVFF